MSPPDSAPFDAVASAARHRATFVKWLAAECGRRVQNVYAPMTVTEGDSLSVRQMKAAFGLARLELWSRDAIRFINDIGWAPDPKGEFGARELPEGCSPPRMVPVVLYPAQESLVRELDAMIAAPGIADINLLKSRQVAATAIVCGLWTLHKWLFHPGFTCLLGSYEKEKIDPGGKGHREGDALFPRLRAMIDAMMWCVPSLRFNQHNRRKFAREADNPAWMSESEDSSMKLVRPRWHLFGADRYPKARRNVIRGMMPSDTFGKGDIYTVIIPDEFGEYGNLGPGVDRKTLQSARHATNHFVTQGTIPDGGGAGSEFKALWDAGDTLPTLRNLTLHWSDIMPAMFGAEWKCPSCSCLSPWGAPGTGPGEKGASRTCSTCGTVATVKRGMLTSPWFRMKCSSMRHDPVSIARYLQMDWGAASGSRFFEGWNRSGGVVPWADAATFASVDGFDPGQSTSNPASWVLVRLDPKRMVPCIVAWWMAPGNLAEWWVPFLKRWDSRRLARMPVPSGKNAGMRWRDAFHYPEEALRMLDVAAKYPRGQVFGDKYGSHKHMTESAYDVLYGYGVEVDSVYTKDREVLCRHGRDWAARMVISEGIADLRPPAPSGSYPSIAEVFEGARLRPNTGQSDWKLDVDKQDPPMVCHPADAWFYACRAFPSEFHAGFDASGQGSPDGMPEYEAVVWGEGA